MQSKSLILLVFALICGVVASIGITQVMARRSATPAAQELETQPVFVVKEDFPMGNVLNADKLKLEQWPKGKVPEGAIGKLEDIEGRRPKAKLFAGEPILEVKLLSKGESAGGAAVTIPLGYRSVPVKVDEVSGGAAMILPGDRVDVLVYVKQSKDIRKTMTKTILQDIKVFAVDSTYTLESDESGQPIRAKTISLLLTPDQTERVMLAHELGKLRLALRSPNDHEEADLPEEGHRIAQIFGDSEMADREKDSVLKGAEPAPQAAPAPVEPTVLVSQRPSHTVRVITGSAVQEVVMQSTEDSEGSSDAGKNGSPAFHWRILRNLVSGSKADGDPAVKNDNKSEGGKAPPIDNPSVETEPTPPEDARTPAN